MSYKNFFTDINLKKKDIPYLSLLFIATLILVILASFNPNKVPQGYDLSIYLFNSIKLAHANVNFSISSYSLFLSPTLCFLASLFIRLGFDYFHSWILVIGIFEIIAAFSFYIFLKNRFNCLLSLTGAILLITTTYTLKILMLSLTDMASIALSTLAFVFFIAAVNKNPKYYILSSIIFILALFTRYTSGLVLPLMIFYYFSKHDLFVNLDNLISDRQKFTSDLKNYLKSPEFKYIIISIVLALVSFYLIYKTLANIDAHLGLISQVTNSVSGFQSSTHDSYYSENSLFYILRYPNGIFNKNSSLFGIRFIYVIFSLIFIGFLLKIYNLFKNREFVKEVYCNRYRFKTKFFDGFLLVFLFLLIGLIFLVKKDNVIFTMTFFLVASVICVSFLNRLNINDDNYSLTCLAICSFCIYFLFFSLINIKLHRYIITTYPAFIYLFILALEEIFSVINYNFIPIKDKYLTNDGFKFEFDKNTKSKIESIILILFFLILVLNSVNAINSYEYSQEYCEIVDMSNYLIKYDSDYISKDITSSIKYYKYFELNLDKEINFVKEKEIGNTTKFNSTYIILKKNINIPDYYIVHQEGDFNLYRHY
ncbi:hypothetical protein [Methanobrevibacter sp.]|uniref:hypothetical protein n=1 Tax=Methanobrevibacter sp. TaxID=66852 RepID=UPI00388D89A9